MAFKIDDGKVCLATGSYMAFAKKCVVIYFVELVRLQSCNMCTAICTSTSTWPFKQFANESRLNASVSMWFECACCARVFTFQKHFDYLA